MRIKVRYCKYSVHESIISICPSLSQRQSHVKTTFQIRSNFTDQFISKLQKKNWNNLVSYCMDMSHQPSIDTQWTDRLSEQRHPNSVASSVCMPVSWLWSESGDDQNVHIPAQACVHVRLCCGNPNNILNMTSYNSTRQNMVNLTYYKVKQMSHSRHTMYYRCA